MSNDSSTSTSTPPDGLMAAAWQNYASHTSPKDASETQLRECKTAFYAGAMSVLGGLISMLDDGPDPTEDDLSKMVALSEELDTYFNSNLTRA